MTFWRKTTLAGLTWLTAAMTLVAGLPHFVCRCPDGTLKPFCLGWDINLPGGCCPHSQQAEPVRQKADEPSCCCCQAKKENGRQCDVQSVGCRRTPAPCAVLISDSRKDLGDRLDSACAIISCNILRSLELISHQDVSSHQAFSIPPPTNRVIALKHLLI